MKNIKKLALMGLFLNAAGCGWVDSLFGIQEGIGIPEGKLGCNTDTDCAVSESECYLSIRCDEGLCAYVPKAAGTPLTAQTPGDCAEIVCDGMGHTLTQPLLGDIEDDQNPCTLDECGENGPIHTPQPQIQVDCYTGTAGTKDIGICKGGIQQCDAQGNLVGACEGEVIPKSEACQGYLDDEDCDGQVNEEGTGCSCVPGTVQACYTGMPGTEGVGPCVGGQWTCNAEGTGFGPCVGEVIPGVETCDIVMEDEDCDGQVNEEGTGCSCVPGTVQACYTGMPATEGVGKCVGGQQTCVAEGTGHGPCVGELTPGVEICDMAMEDEDCDGQVNEEGSECVCSPMSVQACYTGPPGTLGIGICAAGQETCLADGLGFGPCVGEQNPEPLGESCDPGLLDEDCDGQVNEEGSNCICGDGFLSVGEECDDGNQIFTDACADNCKLPVCGDGFTQPSAGETCDDGGTQDGDICSPTCQEQKVLAIEAGARSSCAILSGGRIKCWGYNADGELGLGNTNTYGLTAGTMGNNLLEIDLGAGKTVTALRIGEAILANVGAHACALLSDGNLKCWGRNDYGQLGLGDKNNRGDQANEMGDQLPMVDIGSGLSATSIAIGIDFTCVLLNTGGIKCWGRNDYGQLGQGNTQHRGDDPNEMGTNLQPVNLGPGVTATAISAGDAHVCALLSNGKIKCWGNNSSGQLGQGNTTTYGDGTGPMGALLPEIDLGPGVLATAVSAGGNHTCALLSDGNVKCWGYNLYGQLGLDDTASRGMVGGSMGNALLTVNLGAGKTAIAIHAASGRTCAQLNDSRVKCWGINNVGQLGLGDNNNAPRGDGPGEMANLGVLNLGASQTVTSLSAGQEHTCVLLANHRVKCWGQGSEGQLGYEDGMNRGLSMTSMGDNLPFVKLFSNVW